MQAFQNDLQMLRSVFIFSCCLLGLQHTYAQKQAPAQTPAQVLIANTGEDSLNSYGTGHSKTVISGYGELQYQRDFDKKESTADLKRAVLFVGHQFSGRIAFFSELEVEDAKVAAGSVAGEVGMEQAYLKFSLNPRQYIVAGLFLPRISIVNENHLPINFNGVERPLVETRIIPCTGREIGAGCYGQTTALPFTYCVAVVNGLNNAGFTHGTGFTDGRAEGQLAGANNLALTAAVQFFAGNWKFQVSGLRGWDYLPEPKSSRQPAIRVGSIRYAAYTWWKEIYSITTKGCLLKRWAAMYPYQMLQTSTGRMPITCPAKCMALMQS